MAATLAMSLAACGGVDATEAIDTFNEINTSLTEVSTLANDNIALMDQETTDALTEIAYAFAAYKSELENEDLTQERADEILKELSDYPDQIAALKDTVTELVSNGGTARLASTEGAEISDEQLKALSEAYNAIAPAYNELYDAEANGWLADDQTNTEINTMNALLSQIAKAMTEAPSSLDSSDFDALPGALNELGPAIQEVMARVSVPYEG